MVFSQMSKWTMFAIGLTVGYVCPLIIAVTTVAATAPDDIAIMVPPLLSLKVRLTLILFQKVWLMPLPSLSQFHYLAQTTPTL
ncbi:hypothetical protein CRENBAI_026213 [Crenichthys baileyi]|uniref:Uncharacterized protein n=1 Tax=Crenichthys baileyi TaxID=28760 RepID=A0AAV9SMV6_9TELE